MKPQSNRISRTIGAALVAVLAATANPGVAGTVQHGIGQTATTTRQTRFDFSRLLPPKATARLQQGRGQARLMRPNYPIQPTVFGSDFGANVVQAYNQNTGVPLATIVDPAVNSCGMPPFSAPAGMWVTNTNLRLWVANFGSSDLRMFLAGATTSSMTLVDTDNFNQKTYTPLSVSFDKFASHFLYAGNYQDTMGGPGNIEVWPPGSQSCRSHPKYYLTDPQFANVFFVSNDRTGNLYVDYVDFSSVAHVCFITRANANGGPSNNICSAPGAPAGDYVSSVPLGFPGGIQLYRPARNALGVIDQVGSGLSLLGANLYRPLPLAPVGPAAVPCTTINPSAMFSNPYTFAITNLNGTRMWASEATAVAGGELIRISNAAGPCPATGPGVATLTITGFTQLLGTAVSPPYGP